VPQREAPRRAGDPPSLIADPSLAKSLLGWQAECSDLPTIIRTALAWETRRHNAPRERRE
jgi:UDP-glucose 4-epimerase